MHGNANTSLNKLRSAPWALGIGVVLIVLLYALGAFSPSGRWLYDHASKLAYDWHWSKQTRAQSIYAQRPVLVAVDEPSLRSLGRWPWPRSTHAQLLETLTRSAKPPATVAWDVVFSEPHTVGVQSGAQSIYYDEDAQFTRAINASPFPVILATQFEETIAPVAMRRLVAPRAPISHSSARIAHIHISADVDGSVRRYQAIDRRLQGVALPYLGRALWQADTAHPIKQLSQSQSQSQSQQTIEAAQPGSMVTNQSASAVDDVWLYPMPSNWVRQISYQDVLSGVAQASDWAGVPVLVAATAKGLGDQYVTHLYAPSSVVAGGELVLGAMHTEQLHAAGLPQLRMAHWVLELVLVLALIAVVVLGLPRCRDTRAQLSLLLLTMLFVAAGCLTALALLGIWLNAALLGVSALLIWVLWMSHSLQRVITHIQLRLLRLTHVGQTPATFKIKQESLAPRADARRDVLGAKLLAVTSLEEQQQTVLNRLSQVLNLLPDAAFVLNPNSSPNTTPTHPLNWQLGLHNAAAQQLCLRAPCLHAAISTDVITLNGLLADFVPDLTNDQHAALDTSSVQTVFEWQGLLALHDQTAFTQGVEANSTAGERFLIKVALLHDVAVSDPGGANSFRINALANLGNSIVVSIIDLSVGLKLAQSRERTLNFLSHDIRSPQANIVALLELEKASHPELSELFSKVQLQAERTLHLAEGFVQWSQASHRPAYQFIEYNLNELMIDALDEQWASAKRKGVHLTGYSDDQALWVMLDRSLLWRALVNLISNALNACSADQEVRLSTRQEGQYAVIAVQDNGPGIPTELQAHLFEPFVQGLGLKRTGAGLGLAFVKTVVEQHQGLLKLRSPAHSAPQSHGTLFELWIPLVIDTTPIEEYVDP